MNMKIFAFAALVVALLSINMALAGEGGNDYLERIYHASPGHDIQQGINAVLAILAPPVSLKDTRVHAFGLQLTGTVSQTQRPCLLALYAPNLHYDTEPDTRRSLWITMGKAAINSPRFFIRDESIASQMNLMASLFIGQTSINRKKAVLCCEAMNLNFTTMARMRWIHPR